MSARRLPIVFVLAVIVVWQGPAAASEPGRVVEWLLAGPFPDAQPGKLLETETLADPDALAPSAGDALGKNKWITYGTPTGMVDVLDRAVGIRRTRNSAALAMVYVHSPKMQPAKLLLGFSDGLAAYLNGAKVFQQLDGGGVTADAHRADVLLGEGWNRLYLKIVWYGRFRGQWSFTARLLDPALRPLEGLRFAVKNPYPGGKAEMPKYQPFVAAYHVEHFGTHRIRLVNRTPTALEGVRLIVRSRSGKELMTSNLGKLAGNSHVEADVDADEVFFQQHYAGATAEVRHKGGSLKLPIGRLVLPGTHTIEYETPHIQRMRPWAAGRCRVLLITPGKTRQSIELAQRGDLEWHIVDAKDKDAEKDVQQELALYKFDCIVITDKSGGREPWTWAQVPGKQHLAKAIREGVGVIYVNPSGLTAPMIKVLGLAPGGADPGRAARPGKIEKAADHPIVAGVPVEALPPAAPYAYKFADTATSVAKVGDRPVLAVSEQDGRRAAVLSLGPGNELIWRVPTEDICEPRLPVWERQWSLILKTIIWASKKETPVSVSCAGPAGALDRSEVGQEGKARIRVLVSSAAPSSGSIEVTFRSRGLQPHVTSIHPFEGVMQGEGPAARIPGGLPAGENELDVTVRDKDGKVLGWASSVFQVVPRAVISKIGVAPAKDYYLPGDELTFTVAGKADVEGLKLVMALADNRERIVLSSSRSVDKGAFREVFKLKPQGLLTPVARFKAWLIDADDVLEAEAREIFFVRQELVWDTYEPVLWLTRNSPNWYYDIDYFKLLREVMWIPNGWSASFNPKGSAYYQMVYGGFKSVGLESLHFFSMNHNWTERTFEERRRQFSRTKDIRWLYRTPIVGGKPTDTIDYAKVGLGNDPYNSFFPLDDPEYHEWTGRKIAQQMKAVRRFNPIIYDLMDEGSYTSYARAFDFDFSPVSLKHFRIWLKSRYATLEALNAEWQSEFATWDAVMPMHIHQVRTRAGKMKLPNYAPWVDHRKYSDITYNKYIKLCSDLARRDDADANVGIGGGQRANPYGGWDYWLVADHFTWIENYFEDTDEYVRSFNSPERKVKPCPGKDVWKSVSHGNCGFYRWVDYGHLQGDFSLLPRGTTTAKQLAEVRGGGLGKLFLGAEPVDDPIAMHYSQSTIQVSYALGRADQLGNGGPLNAKLGFYNLLEELGYQFKFVSHAQVEDGHLDKAGYKLMILPESIALSDAEAAGLKKFVEGGGVLLCDRMIGEWNEHGRRRAKTVLEESFGMDPDQPAEKNVGKGVVMYLAGDFPVQYWRDRNGRPVQQYWDKMGAVLKRAALPKPRARVLTDAGQPARRTEIRYFKLGKIAYHVVRAEVPDAYEFVAAAPGHVYEMRDGRYGGADGRIAIRSEPDLPALVAVSPYKITGVAAAAEAGAVKRGAAVKVSATVQASAAPDTHALNFRVYGPDGAERRHYGKTVFAQNGSAAITIPTALNEAQGKWTVKVCDLASGALGTAAFEVAGE